MDELGEQAEEWPLWVTSVALGHGVHEVVWYPTPWVGGL